MPRNLSHLLTSLLVVAMATVLTVLLQSPSQAQQTNAEALRAAQQEAERRAEAEKTLSTIGELLNEKRNAEAKAEELRQQVATTLDADEALKDDLEKQRSAALEKIKDIESRITALTTGAQAEDFEKTGREKFDLNAELENLAKPFVAMLRAATESARQIETLRSTIKAAERRLDVAERAVERLELLKSLEPQDANGTGAALIIAEHEESWRKRLTETKTLRDSARQQLKLEIAEQAQTQDGVGSFVTDFIQTRGFNLLMGLLAFISIFTVLRLIGRAAGYLQRRRGIPRNFFTRLISLVFQAFTMVVSVFAMLVVFNALSDWLLLGFTAVVVLALAWIGIKMLPSIIEQITLLLNLGAVQEGERVTINGVPWRVERLDYYTDLVNPALEGGHFSVPVRELSGHHSRPAAVDEAWFPTDKGDWLQLDDGRVARVAIQTPELVQLIELGGARLTYATPDFIARAPRNLSKGYRVELVFGIDYRHQSQATELIPETMRAYVEKGLIKFVGAEHLVQVNVELLKAGDSSIDYEVEADLKGSAAHRCEDVEREMARLLVAACNTYGWTIPFPQLVVNRAELAKSNGASASHAAQDQEPRRALPRITDQITPIVLGE